MIFFNRFRSSWPFILLLLLLLLEILIFLISDSPSLTLLFSVFILPRLSPPQGTASGHRSGLPPRGCTPRAIDDENYLKRLCVIAWHWISSFLWRHIGSPLLLPPTPPLPFLLLPSGPFLRCLGFSGAAGFTARIKDAPSSGTSAHQVRVLLNNSI